MSLKHDLVTLMPQARRYGRALIGDTGIADALLVESTINVIKHAPPWSFLTPTNMVLPWLFIELHKLLDSSSTRIKHEQFANPDRYESILYEQIDAGLCTLSDLQKRVYLLTALEQFKVPVTAHILDLTTEQVMHEFQQAHKLVHDYVNNNFRHKDAA